MSGARASVCIHCKVVRFVLVPDLLCPRACLGVRRKLPPVRGQPFLGSPRREELVCKCKLLLKLKLNLHIIFHLLV